MLLVTKWFVIRSYYFCIGNTSFCSSVYNESFPLLITGLFIVGLGFLYSKSLLILWLFKWETIKRKYAFEFSRGINNVGTTIGPVIVSFAIFGSLHQVKLT